MEIFFGEMRETNFCSISGVFLIHIHRAAQKNVRNQRIGRSGGEEQKDIKLKVVKSSSRFSIYFQLHSPFSWVFFANVFLCAHFPAAQRKWAEIEKSACVCKCGL